MATTKDYPRLSTLTALGFILTAHIDRGAGGEISLDDVHDAVAAGTLWEMLQEKVPDIELGLITETRDQSPKVLGVIGEAAAIMRDRERRKYGVENNGLCMLIACILEAIQQEWWEHPRGTAPVTN